MEKLFYRNGEFPAPLPNSAVEEATQRRWTDLENSPEAREACGFVEAPAQPEFDPATQQLDWTGSEWTIVALPPQPEPPAPSKDDLAARVMLERDTRIAGGLTFNGVRYQTRPEDETNVQGAFSLALAAVVTGAGTPGNARWADPEADFEWIAEDDSKHLMDAPTVMAFGAAIAARRKACIFHARALKDAINVAADPTTVDINQGWPDA